MDSEAVHTRAMRESMSTELARLMKLEGISQSGLSRATGVPQPTINRILSQVTQDPRRDSMISIANYFGVALESLYSSSPAQKTSKKDPKAVGCERTWECLRGRKNVSRPDCPYHAAVQHLADFEKRFGHPLPTNLPLFPLG